MIPIFKQAEPTSLLTYRLQAAAKYDGPNFTQVKSDVRKALLEEQGYLCAYCMQRINDDQLTTKIDHWQCQDRYPHEQLNYRNMLAVCLGNAQDILHCDSAKGNLDIAFNPSDPAHSSQLRIKYSTSGSISSEDGGFDSDINDVLVLNKANRLVQNRKAVIDAVKEALSRKSGRRTQAEINKFIQEWESIDISGKKKPYCGVAVFFLNKKLAQCP